MTSSKGHFKSSAPHVLAKHAILTGYLVAWFAILARAGKRRVIYVDGFAGPGTFEDGQAGSPVRALQVAMGSALPPDFVVDFYFIEKKEEFAEQLERDSIPKLRPPNRFRWQVKNGEFADILPSLLQEWQSAEFADAPTFAFIDPFGVKGVPFELVRKILGRPSSEVFVTLMNEGVRRCIAEYPEHVNELFGRDDAAQRIGTSSDKVAAARGLYREALESTGAHVCMFQIRDRRNRPLYDLFFATHSALGLVKMKEAMWKVDRAGYFLFSDARDPAQQSFFSEEPGERFARELWETFRGRTMGIEEIDQWADRHRTFLRQHARSAIQVLEQGGGFQGMHLKVNRAACKGGRKASARQFPAGTTVEFLG